MNCDLPDSGSRERIQLSSEGILCLTYRVGSVCGASLHNGLNTLLHYLQTPRTQLLGAVVLTVSVLLGSGCATPNVSQSRQIPVDQDDGMGGSFLESYDIRAIAAQMGSALLSVPEIAQAPDATYIAISPVRNSTRYIIDKDMLMTRLRIELNQYSAGRIRFFAQGLGQGVRSEVLGDQDEEAWDALLSECAAAIVTSEAVTGSERPVRLAVIPVTQANLVGVNADSLTALLRSKISEQAQGKVQFLARDDSGKVISQILAEQDLNNAGLIVQASTEPIAGVDYFLGGQFVAQSLQTQAAQVTTTAQTGANENDPRIEQTTLGQSSTTPNANKYLTVMLIDAATGTIPVEKTVLVERKLKSGVSRANYLLTGELRSLSKASDAGDRSDYVTVSFQLVHPQSNEIVWEDVYETKKVTRSSVLYK